MLNDDPQDDTSALFALPSTRHVALDTSSRPNVDRTTDGTAARTTRRSRRRARVFGCLNDSERWPIVHRARRPNQSRRVAQWFPDSGFVRVDRLSDGTPVAGAGVAVYQSQTSAKVKNAAIPCATTQTGADGIAHFSGSGFAACAALDGGQNTAPSLVTIVRNGADWMYVRSDDGSGAYAAKPLYRLVVGDADRARHDFLRPATLPAGRKR